MAKTIARMSDAEFRAWSDAGTRNELEAQRFCHWLVMWRSIGNQTVLAHYAAKGF